MTSNLGKWKRLEYYQVSLEGEKGEQSPIRELGEDSNADGDEEEKSS